MSLNWPNLVAKGRAKDIGIAWSEDEQEALRTLRDHTGKDFSELAPFVREGILTVEDFDGAKAPKTRKELEAEADEAGIEFAPETPDTVLGAAVAKAPKAKAPKSK